MPSVCRRCTLGMYCTRFHARSSTRTKTMFGGVAAAAGTGDGPEEASAAVVVRPAAATRAAVAKAADNLRIPFTMSDESKDSLKGLFESCKCCRPAGFVVGAVDHDEMAAGRQIVHDLSHHRAGLGGGGQVGEDA